MAFILTTFVFNFALMVRVYDKIYPAICEDKNFKKMMFFFVFQLFAYILVFIKVFSQLDNDFYDGFMNFFFPLKGLANAIYFKSLIPSNKPIKDDLLAERELQYPLE